MLLHRYFEQQADLLPDNIALSCHGELHTYRDLERRANQMAHWLQSQRIGRGDLVGLLLECTVDFYIANLAILKIGAAYIPIDKEYPLDRIQYMLTNSNASLLLTNSHFTETLKDAPCRVLNLDNQQQTIANCRDERLNLAIDEDDLCYIIYTSGTTGKPKGVAVKHRSICNYVDSVLKIYDIHSSDRVYQGFSIAFDASLEEIWIAFASGATLVVGTNNNVHAGAGLIDFLNFHKITVFSAVPTMLALLEGVIPSLRVLILGGEACTPALVTTWSRDGLRIFNTYGPTEATIIASYAECQPGRAITIGKPLPNCEMKIFNEALQPVAVGEFGELYIGGECLAQGYVNNPELTANKFIPHPDLQGARLYRTGDKACFNQDGDIQLAGRLDDQIKLRGFRIELSEIEGVLQQYPGVLRAVVNPMQMGERDDTLIAYLLLKSGNEIVIEELIEFLNVRLPNYMVPSLFEMVTKLPVLANGKIDRKQLPKPHLRHEDVKKDYVAPRSDLEEKIKLVWENVFKHAPISSDANFFQDLGGHSLTAAKVISLLRKDKELQTLSILDLYENPTIEKLAERVEKAKLEDIPIHEEDTVFDKAITIGYKTRFLLCSIAQLFGIYAQFVLSSCQFVIIFLALSVSMSQFGVWSFPFFGVLFAIIIFLQPILLLMTLASKWLLLGRIKPGKYKLWGWFYFRWWLVQQMLGLVSTEYLTGSPFINVYFRLMGAKIGKRCYINTDCINAFDLLSIDDDASLNEDVIAQGFIVRPGVLEIGSIQIGKRCYVGANSVLGINTVLEDDAKLGEQSMLPDNNIIPSNQHYIGSPARLGNVSVPNVSQINTENTQRFNWLYYAGLFYLTLIYCLAIAPGVILLDYFLFLNGNQLACLWIAPLGGVLFIILIGTLVVISKRYLIGKIKPGCYPLHSVDHVKKWLADKLIGLTYDVSYALFATMYSPTWFRLLGAKIGKRTELSTMSASSPDLVTIGDECFIADGGVVGSARIYHGYIELANVELKNRVFIGNSAFVPINTQIEDNCLIACLSVPPANAKIKENTSWLGSPAVFLPRRDIFTGFSENVTYQPSLKLWVIRGLIDLVKIMLPAILFFSMLALDFLAIKFLLDYADLFVLFLLFPIIDFFITLSANAVIVLMKWLLMGQYVETSKPAWSVYVWLNELVTGLYDSVSTPILLEGLCGTPYMAMFLRLLGAKIGRRVYIGTTFFSEFDLIDIQDDACLNTECTIQTHLFEDRVLKMAPLKIEESCTVGSRSIVLYNTIMECHASLSDLSLLMKGEILPAYSQWEGIPAQHK